jgi:hypothetical protein
VQRAEFPRSSQFRVKAFSIPKGRLRADVRSGGENGARGGGGRCFCGHFRACNWRPTNKSPSAGHGELTSSLQLADGPADSTPPPTHAKMAAHHHPVESRKPTIRLGESVAITTRHSFISTKIADRRRSLRRYSSLADWGRLRLTSNGNTMTH